MGRSRPAAVEGTGLGTPGERGASSWERQALARAGPAMPYRWQRRSVPVGSGELIESFAEFAIVHEAGHAVVGQFVKVSAPTGISFALRRDATGSLYLGDFATSSLFPPDEEIADLPDYVKRCICYMLAGGLAATQFSGLTSPDADRGLGSDRMRLSKLTSESLESFLPNALAVIRKEQGAFEEVISQCRKRYEQLKSENVADGEQYLLSKQELEAIFKRTMSPLRAPLTPAEFNPEFVTTMSAHEAGHATLGITLGARVEAVYAVITDRLPNGNYRLCYLTKFGSFARVGLGLKEMALITAGGAAGEMLLNGKIDPACVEIDKIDMEKLGVSNFDYCLEQATRLLGENSALLTETRKKISSSMSNLRSCKLTKKGTHIILAKGPELERLFKRLGVAVSSSVFDLGLAGHDSSTPGSGNT